MSSTIKILDKQTLLDVAAIHFGNPDCVFDILRKNRGLNLSDSPAAGTQIEIPNITTLKSGEAMPRLKSYLGKKNIATGITPGNDLRWILATGFWNDGGIWVDKEFWND